MGNLLKKIHKYFAKNEGTNSAKILLELVAALDEGKDFKVTKLYDLPYDAFELALNLIKEWRLESYRRKPGDLPDAIKGASVGPEASWVATVETQFFD